MKEAQGLILVTGATGAVGPRVVEALIEAGYRVRTFSIDLPPKDVFGDRVEALIGDITDPAAVAAAMRGIDGVIHLAALLHILNPGSTLRGEYERINVGGTAHVVAAAVKAGVRRMVFFSTIAVYGAAEGRILTEDSSVRPASFYAQTKLAAERIVLEARHEDGTPLGTVLRPGAVYGARIKGNYERLVKALARGRFLPIGSGSNRRTLVYDRDVAQAALLALRHPVAAGEVFNVSDGEFHKLTDIIKTMCRALDRKPPRFTLPLAPVRFGVGLAEDMARLLRLSPRVGRASVDKYTEDTAVDSTRIQRKLGFAPQYDLSAGWEETISEMRQAGLL